MSRYTKKTITMYLTITVQWFNDSETFFVESAGPTNQNLLVLSWNFVHVSWFQLSFSIIISILGLSKVPSLCWQVLWNDQVLIDQPGSAILPTHFYIQRFIELLKNAYLCTSGELLENHIVKVTKLFLQPLKSIFKRNKSISQEVWLYW